jgi:hypothetical protein
LIEKFKKPRGNRVKWALGTSGILVFAGLEFLWYYQSDNLSKKQQMQDISETQTSFSDSINWLLDDYGPPCRDSIPIDMKAFLAKAKKDRCRWPLDCRLDLADSSLMAQYNQFANHAIKENAQTYQLFYDSTMIFVRIISKKVDKQAWLESASVTGWPRKQKFYQIMPTCIQEYHGPFSNEWIQ